MMKHIKNAAPPSKHFVPDTRFRLGGPGLRSSWELEGAFSFGFKSMVVLKRDRFSASKRTCCL